MVVQSEDGTTWSALTGMGIDGPRAGKRLKRIPSLVTSWDYWMMLHPESTTYDLFDGKKYPTHPLPTKISDESIRSRLTKDQRLADHHPILGIEIGIKRHAFPLPEKEDRACFLDEIDNQSIAVFWYRASNTAVAFDRKVQGRLLTFYADEISPATAPFKDKETGTRWSMAGRGIDGPLRGVMREQIINLAPSIGLTVEEESVSPFALQQADELWLSNAIHGVVAISRFRRHDFGHKRAQAMQMAIVSKSKDVQVI